MKNRRSFRTVLFALAAFALWPLCAAAQTPSPVSPAAGDWQGTLSAGGAQLHLVLHIADAPDGTLKATLDSVDQGALNIPVTSIALRGDNLNLSVAAVHGSYDGRLSKSGDEIRGTWTQRQPLDLDFKRIEPPSAAARPVPPSDIDGAWLGTLDLGVAKLRILFHIASTAAGLSATMDSPDQGAKGLPTTSVTRTGDKLTIEAQQLDGVFTGTIARDHSAIVGTWTQRGHSIPLTLTPVKDAAAIAEPKRPQNPTKPYPYQSIDVTYINPTQHDTLAATLTLPPGAGPFPAVLLIPGSGPNDRNETIFGHKLFLVLSDYLTRHGIVVLRADKRGVGQSTGDLATATTADFATDAEAGVAFLKNRTEVDPHRIGLIGHSEGGIIAAMVAAQQPQSIDFIVMMAGSGVPGIQLIPEQTLLLGEAAGVSPATAEKNADDERKLLDLVVAAKDTAQGTAALDQELRAQLAARKIPAGQIDATIHSLTSPWFRYFLAYDPATALRHVTGPVLALDGSKDLQVPPAQNLPAIRAALTAAGNTHFQIVEMPGLNHLFQTATTGSPLEYATIEETIAPAALNTITDWVIKQS